MENTTAGALIFPCTGLWNSSTVTGGQPEFDELAGVRESLEIASNIVYGVSAVLTLSNNMMTILAVARFRDLQKRTNAFVLNLTISDLLNFIALLALLLMEIPYITDQTTNDVLSCVAMFIHILSKFISLLTLLLIALDRYSAVIQPIKHRWKTTKEAIKTILLCWLISFISPGVVVYYMVRDDNYDNLIAFLTPVWVNILVVQVPIWFVIISCLFLYCRVICKIRKRVRKITELRATNQIIDGRTAKVISENKRIIQMMAIILCTAVITWVPYSLLVTIMDKEKFDTNAGVMISYRCLSWFIHFNGFVNPWIYAWSSSAFKDAYIKLLCCKGKTKR